MKFSQEEIEKIFELHNNGLFNREIAVLLNTSTSSISRFLQSTDLPSRHPSLSEERINEVVKLTNCGKTIREIEKILHMGSQTIKNIREEYGINKSISESKRKYKINEKYFDVIDTHEKAYFLGLLYADGCVHNNCISISLQDTDVSILNRFKEELCTDKPLYFIKKKKESHKDQYVLSLCSEHIKESLSYYGVTERKSLTIKFPRNLNKEFYCSFLHGYFDGDGSISKNPHDKRMTLVGTRDFCFRSKEIIESELGIHCSVIKAKKNSNTDVMVLQVSGGIQARKLFEWFESKGCPHIDRKYKVYQDIYCEKENNSLSA